MSQMALIQRKVQNVLNPLLYVGVKSGKKRKIKKINISLFLQNDTYIQYRLHIIF
jgi:hypothetical protein